jgi:molybdopterin-containing oxidoreductase family iron-sulfur binding subunit
VTVRSRGVMEKCTYCVQRINTARIEAKKQTVIQGKEVRIPDGSLMTACQQACPTEAIVFGDLNDKDAKVNQLKSSPLNYGVLADLGTQPRTTYLAQLKNPNPLLVLEEPISEEGHSAAGGHGEAT